MVLFEEMLAVFWKVILTLHVGIRGQSKLVSEQKDPAHSQSVLSYSSITTSSLELYPGFLRKHSFRKLPI